MHGSETVINLLFYYDSRVQFRLELEFVLIYAKAFI